MENKERREEKEEEKEMRIFCSLIQMLDVKKRVVIVIERDTRE